MCNVVVAVPAGIDVSVMVRATCRAPNSLGRAGTGEPRRFDSGVTSGLSPGRSHRLSRRPPGLLRLHPRPAQPLGQGRSLHLHQKPPSPPLPPAPPGPHDPDPPHNVRPLLLTPFEPEPPVTLLVALLVPPAPPTPPVAEPPVPPCPPVANKRTPPSSTPKLLEPPAPPADIGVGQTVKPCVDSPGMPTWTT